MAAFGGLHAGRTSFMGSAAHAAQPWSRMRASLRCFPPSSPTLPPLFALEPRLYRLSSSQPAHPHPDCPGFAQLAKPHSVANRRRNLVPEAAFGAKVFEGQKLAEENQQLDTSVCPGCGVLMQNKDPTAPGYFVKPVAMVEEKDEDGNDLRGGDAIQEEEEEEDEEEEQEQREKTEMKTSAHGRSEWKWVQLSDKEDEEWKKSLDGFAPVGPEYGGLMADSKPSMKKQKGREKKKERKEQEKVLVCARCHSLRYYGKVKDETLENLLPDFDFDQTVGARLMKASGNRSVVLMVVDAADFDGSFPQKAAALLSNVAEQESEAWRQSKPGNAPRLVLVVNKIDLLPGQVSPTRLEHWMRRRAKAGGAPRLNGLFLVSALKGWGIRALVTNIQEMVGPRGEAWVVGAQNAGKSSLINALGRVDKDRKVTQLTEAPIPGTTLGILRVEGVLPAKAKLFDTPGILHPHQMTVRLNREELKMVQVLKELKPRTYRTKVNDSIHIGGLVRLDVKEVPASSIYITVWASAHIPCHMGKTEKANELFEKHIGDKLKPPMNNARVEELGRWVQTSVKVTGDSWDRSTIDVAIAGVGWFGLALKGTTTLDVWTYEGVAITTREALVLDLASTFEKPGFTVVKGVSSTENKNDKKSIVVDEGKVAHKSMATRTKGEVQAL